MNELESGIENISRSFLSLLSLVLDSGLSDRSPLINRTLYDTIQQCLSLTRSGCDSSNLKDADAAVLRLSQDTTIPDNEGFQQALGRTRPASRLLPSSISGFEDPCLPFSGNVSSMPLYEHVLNHDQVSPANAFDALLTRQSNLLQQSLQPQLCRVARYWSDGP